MPLACSSDSGVPPRGKYTAKSAVRFRLISPQAGQYDGSRVMTVMSELLNDLGPLTQVH